MVLQHHSTLAHVWLPFCPWASYTDLHMLQNVFHILWTGGLPCLLALLGAPVAHPLLSHPPAPPYEDFTSPYDMDCPVRGWLVTAVLPPPWRAPPGARGAAAAFVEDVGTL